MVYAVTTGGLCVSISFLLSRIQASATTSEAITSRSPASEGVSRPVVARLPPSTTIAAPAVEPHSASQPTQSSRSPANRAAATGQQHRHGAHHQRGVAHRGQRQSVKLQQELNGNAEERGDQQRPHFARRQPHAMRGQHRRHAQAGKQKAVEHHVLHVHLVEREPAPVEPRAPQGSGQRARAVAQKPPACAIPHRSRIRLARRVLCHLIITVAHTAVAPSRFCGFAATRSFAACLLMRFGRGISFHTRARIGENTLRWSSGADSRKHLQQRRPPPHARRSLSLRSSYSPHWPRRRKATPCPMPPRRRRSKSDSSSAIFPTSLRCRPLSPFPLSRWDSAHRASATWARVTFWPRSISSTRTICSSPSASPACCTATSPTATRATSARFAPWCSLCPMAPRRPRPRGPCTTACATFGRSKMAIFFCATATTSSMAMPRLR